MCEKIMFNQRLYAAISNFVITSVHVKFVHCLHMNDRDKRNKVHLLYLFCIGLLSDDFEIYKFEEFCQIFTISLCRSFIHTNDTHQVDTTSTEAGAPRWLSSRMRNETS